MIPNICETDFSLVLTSVTWNEDLSTQIPNKVYLNRSSAINEQFGGLAGFRRCITSVIFCRTGSGDDTFRSGAVIGKWSSGLEVTFVFARPRGSCNATPVTNRPDEIEKNGKILHQKCLETLRDVNELCNFPSHAKWWTILSEDRVCSSQKWNTHLWNENMKQSLMLGRKRRTIGSPRKSN